LGENRGFAEIMLGKGRFPVANQAPASGGRGCTSETGSSTRWGRLPGARRRRRGRRAQKRPGMESGVLNLGRKPKKKAISDPDRSS